MCVSTQKRGVGGGGWKRIQFVAVAGKAVGSNVGETQVQISAPLSSSSVTLNMLLYLSKPTFPQLSKGKETATTP